MITAMFKAILILTILRWRQWRIWCDKITPRKWTESKFYNENQLLKNPTGIQIIVSNKQARKDLDKIT